MTEVTVRIVHDFICPWCFIGQKNMQSIASTWADKYKISVEFSSYFLNEKIPRETGMSAEKYVEEKYGKSAKSNSKPSDLFKMAEDADIFLPKTYHNGSRTIYHSGRAHLLEKYASQKLEDSAKLWNLVTDIYSAYHIENRNIDSEEVLLSIASNYDLPEEEVRNAINDEAELEQTYKESDRNKEIEVGVPQFYFYKNGKEVVNQISGAQNTRNLLKELKIVAEK
uniref:DSBA-like thioredoxin domain-containing protein n=2 Tax=Aplanochytrium stocchinoi TaxID=215587 RepID=A0A7S3PIN9_9STRA|mmetsp:Transcript_4352/g.5481  ORF Transcript_4352/g.5481 Transcript_4352/m.5481 type:complete len:225 (+) Transcript_4352:229-903(+)|eukprot:CAMPEP_0204821936 /NCGR_PEP_ID=MMETSP1346-20131115/134_1 /ASSEMBLY_ACC=CAM_ASM_000771 /TAXON_ID=215587 /ORGANISM="Aplanochytrium stocchinoi, Strain GSBS06" /LENGTH=224 /DNA_ID=CAMNT_0051947905 /DNA_START=71 /DNA_END=745 /DNA_ORIENTATION=+